LTNGFVERKDNRIKAMERMAYGYHNIENLRRRILLANNEIAASTKASWAFQAYWKKLSLTARGGAYV